MLLVQICEGSDEPDNEQNIHDRIYGVGEQFVNDFQTIDQQFQDNDFIQYIFEKTVSKISISNNKKNGLNGQGNFRKRK